ncbi:hypothetical protein [Burkholderia sp. MSMB1589WGS]|uniref:hypothetical protein n=1 Tax=Burkholderia sp. MSMB1589WGS TaxID=1636425 RepID=UPI0012E94BA0|nr:hypothetical protein [Burkholderia sp. MSMB1589WGS]
MTVNDKHYCLEALPETDLFPLASVSCRRPNGTRPARLAMHPRRAGKAGKGGEKRVRARTGRAAKENVAKDCVAKSPNAAEPIVSDAA